MAVTFPTSPTNGQTFTANGLSYVYNATYGVWRLNVSAGGSSGGGGVTTYATVAELPLTNNTNGDMAFVEETDRLYLSNDNGWFNIALINTSPTITNGGTGSYVLATDGTPTVITLTATDPEEVPLTWSYTVTSGALGTTATVSQADNVFTITPGTTDPDDAGTFEITFSVTDGTNIVNDVNTFSLVFSTIVENSKYTTALITTDGTTGNNTAFTDSSSNALTITPAGTPSSQSFSPYRSGGYSVEIDASAGNWIQAQSHSDFAFGTGDFTVEFWMKSQKSDQWLLLIDQQYQAQGVSIWINPTNELVYYPNSSTPALTSQALTMSDWIHVALVRNSGTTKFYVNGVWNSTSYSDSQNFPTNLPLKMGSDYSAAQYGYKGYFRDVRVTNTAVYSTNFTPPTEPLTEIAGTRLLTCQSLTFKDESTTPHTIGITGTPSIVPVGPYDQSTSYSKSSHGGSVYFDGSGDYLSIPNNVDLQPQSDNFTLECWVYVTDNDGSQSVAILAGMWRQATGRSWMLNVTSTGFALYANTSVTVFSGSYDFLNKWTHIAWVKDGSTNTFYINGVEETSGTLTTYNNSTDVLAIGFNLDGAPSSWYFDGYISDFRIVKGTAVYTSNFTPPTEPLSSSGATLHVIGTDANIIDKAQTNTLTLVGNTTASTTESKYAGSSIYFNGSGDYIDLDFNAIGTTDFTFECWVYVTDSTANQLVFDTRPTSTDNTTGFNLQYRSNNVFSVGSYSVTYITGSTSLTDNTWYHVAVTRLGSTMTLWVNGQSDGTSSHSVDLTSSDLRIGTNRSAVSVYHGYIEDFRLTKGLARYTANFTPPTASLDG